MVRPGFLVSALSAGLVLLLPLEAASARPQRLAEGGALADGGAVPQATLVGARSTRARVAADRILEALRSGDANTRFSQFSPSLQRITSPSMVEATIRSQPRLISWTITKVMPGLDSTTVEASLNTSGGVRDLVMVIDEDGKLEGYHFEAADESAESVVRKFITALTTGNFITASSFLSLAMQQEIPTAQLQLKWQQLERSTGRFQAIERVSLAEDSGDMKLVLVNTRFNRLTDNLFVILDQSNEIIGVDFPLQPAGPLPVPVSR